MGQARDGVPQQCGLFPPHGPRRGCGGHVLTDHMVPRLGMVWFAVDHVMDARMGHAPDRWVPVLDVGSLPPTSSRTDFDLEKCSSMAQPPCTESELESDDSVKLCVRPPVEMEEKTRDIYPARLLMGHQLTGHAVLLTCG